MVKLQIKLQDLFDLGILLDVLISLNLNANINNFSLRICKDYLQGTLPEKYKDYKPDLSEVITLEIPLEYLFNLKKYWSINEKKYN